MSKILIFGPGTKYLGGVSYYVIALANALSTRHETTSITFNNLLPKFLFPGKKRVGKIKAPPYNNQVKHYSGLNWYLGAGFFKSVNILNRRKPDILLFQWWSSSALHIYSLLVLLNRLFWKKKIIIELHEIVDPYENSILPLRLYVKLFSRFVLRSADAYTVHSEHDKKLMHSHFKLPKERIFVVPLGNWNIYRKSKIKRNEKDCNLLFFGLIRPYKGVEYLIQAFNNIPEAAAKNFKLTIVGETWENFNLPKQLIEESKYRDRITFINRYVSDDEIGKYFSQADVAIIPYTRASQSGPAHTAVFFGLPLICSRVGGLVESMSQYKGTRFVEPKDIKELTKEIMRAYPDRRSKYPNPTSWDNAVKANEIVFKAIQ